MSKPPDQWIARVSRLCTRAGLPMQDAEECVAETLTRYRRRRGTYPWDDPAPDEPLLRLLAHNVACEYNRTTARRQQLERDYCAQQQAVIAAAATPQEQAIANADAAQFRASLPRYLRRTLTLLEAGYTPAEIAAALGISESTVRAYRRELKAHFIKFFGYDPTNRGRCVVNSSGSAQTGFQTNLEEVADDETAEAFGHHGVGVSDSEPCGDAPHLGGAERVQRGGVANPVMSSGDCGCSQPPMEVSPKTLRDIVDRQNQRIVPTRVLCYHQDECKQDVDPVFRCRDVFWPCSWEQWHLLERGWRKATVCKMNDGRWCVMYHICDRWEKKACCEEEFDHCPPTNPSCHTIPPCAIP